MIDTCAHSVTDSDLASRVHDGNQLAALELFVRYEPFVRRLAARHGTHVCFDREDVRQEMFIQVVLCAVKAIDTGEDFAKVFTGDAQNAVALEAAKYKHPVPIPVWTFRLVHAAVKEHGSPAKAREALAAAESWRRVSPDLFDAVWLLAFGVHLEWSTPSVAQTVVDESPDQFAAIEDADYARYLLDLVEHGLGQKAREVIARTYGLDGYPAAIWNQGKDEFLPATSAVVAAEMGLHDVTVRRIRSRAIAYLQINAEEI